MSSIEKIGLALFVFCLVGGLVGYFSGDDKPKAKADAGSVDPTKIGHSEFAKSEHLKQFGITDLD